MTEKESILQKKKIFLNTKNANQLVEHMRQLVTTLLFDTATALNKHTF